MALAEAARFATLQEADIACSALNAMGVPAEVFDRNYAGNVWTNQIALGGVRIMTRAEDLGLAVEILREAHGSDPSALRWGAARGVVTGAPLAVLAAVLGADGWVVAAAKQRPSPTRLAVAAIYLLWLAFILAILSGAMPRN